MRVLITGGAGFIGSALARRLMAGGGHSVLVYDALTYASSPEALKALDGRPGYAFVQGDVCDAPAVAAALAAFRPEIIAHLAAETHVDRSIDAPQAFVRTNVMGTAVMLEQALAYWRGQDAAGRERFRFHHISTDEVFGSLGDAGRFTETSPYDPRSPYAASKAGADHLVRAWGKTYGLPVLVTNCSNNYGPFHFPEKLIPLVIARALQGRTLPVYGDGEQVRDWLHVDDHARALEAVFLRGAPGRTYNVGGDAERRNIDVVRAICSLLDRMRPREDGLSYAEQIVFAPDRPGHDRRYAIDASRIRNELGWAPEIDFDRGLEATVAWYLENEAWWRAILAGRYDGGRLGTA